MKGFILGRSTIQWMSVIGATLSFAGVVIGLIRPELADEWTILAGGLTAVLAVWVGFLANTGTTPVDDARLERGTVVSVTNEEGDIVGKSTVK